MSLHNHKAGFSLIELLVALSILAVVAAIIVPKFLNVRSQAATVSTEAQKKTIQNAVQQFMSLGGNLNSATAGPILAYLSGGITRTTTAASGIPYDSSGSISSQTISLQITPKASSQTSQPSTTGTSGFYWDKTEDGLAWYVDSSSTVYAIGINLTTGDVTTTKL